MKIGKKIVSFIIAVLILAAPVAGLSKNVSALENAEFTNTKISNVKLSNAVTSASDKSFWMSMSSDYYYRHLNATEKKLYNRIYDASFPILFNDENVTNFTVDCSDLSLSLYDAKKVIMLFKLDNPQIFFFSRLLSYYPGSNDTVRSLILYLDTDFQKGSFRAAARTDIFKAVKKYVSLVSNNARIEEQEILVIASMCDDIKYVTGAKYNQSIYSAVLGETVCAGYMSLFTAVMNACGIECTGVTSEDHGWNIIKLHGYWYYVDVTNADQSWGLYYHYYNSNKPTSVVEDVCSGYLPTFNYDELASEYDYSLRYFTSDGFTYFIVNDSNSSGLVTPAYGKNATAPSTVKYKGTTYSVVYSSERQTGWKKTVFGWNYYNSSGTILTEWQKIGGDWYYMDSRSGIMTTGWYEDSGYWYYFTPSTGVMATGWKQINNKWYLFDGSGAMTKGWKFSGGNYYYFDSEGAMVTGWKQIDGKWYLFDNEGIMTKGWKLYNGKYYYFTDGGDMVTGWKKIGGVYYYFNTDGSMATGWKAVNGKWYYLVPSTGAMVTGWKQINGSWYYFNNDGDMKTGWLYTGGVWYYMKSDGVMATGKQTINGKTYNFGNDGIWDGKDAA